MTSHSLLFSILGTILFVGLAWCRQWLFTAYWVSWGVTLVWMLTALTTSTSDLPEIFGLAVILAFLGIFLQRKRNWFGYGAAT